MKSVFRLLAMVLALTTAAAVPAAAYEFTDREQTLTRSQSDWPIWVEVKLNPGDASAWRPCNDWYAKMDDILPASVTVDACVDVAEKLSGIGPNEHRRLPVGTALWVPSMTDYARKQFLSGRDKTVAESDQFVLIKDFKSVAERLAELESVVREHGTQIAIHGENIDRLAVAQNETATAVGQISDQANANADEIFRLRSDTDERVGGVEKQTADLANAQKEVGVKVDQVSEQIKDLSVGVGKLIGKLDIGKVPTSSFALPQSYSSADLKIWFKAYWPWLAGAIAFLFVLIIVGSLWLRTSKHGKRLAHHDEKIERLEDDFAIMVEYTAAGTLSSNLSDEQLNTFIEPIHLKVGRKKVSIVRERDDEGKPLLRLVGVKDSLSGVHPKKDGRFRVVQIFNVLAQKDAVIGVSAAKKPPEKAAKPKKTSPPESEKRSEEKPPEVEAPVKVVPPKE